MIDLIEKNICTGCTSCKAACPKQCINMNKDEDGFYYPTIDVNHCINCNLCEKVCPVLNKLHAHKQTVTYAVMNNNEVTRSNSTSGGFFSVLANYVLEKEGYVIGASFNDQYVVKHIIIDKKSDLHKLMGAKYSQSELGNIFSRTKKLLDENKYVLFSGTPCQVGGLKAYLRNEYAKLLTVDLVCHGVPSPKVWESYVKYRSNKDNSGLLPSRINLRSKSSGWSKYKYSIEFDYENFKYSCVNYNDLFMKVFVGNYCLRQSCSNCSFKGIHRVSDFTLGDYWGVWDQLPEMDDNKGTSLVFVHGKKAQDIFELVSRQIKYQSVDTEISISMNPSMIISSTANKNRNAFLKEINDVDFEELVNKYLNSSCNNDLIFKIKSKIKKLFYKLFKQ